VIQWKMVDLYQGIALAATCQYKSTFENKIGKSTLEASRHEAAFDWLHPRSDETETLNNSL